MSKKQKLLLSSVVILGLLGVAKYSAPKQPVPAQQNQQQNSQAAIWKTYTNIDYGFQFQYPSEADFTVDNGGAKPDHPIIHLIKNLSSTNSYSIAVLLSANDAYPLPHMPSVLSDEEMDINGIKMTKTLYGPPRGSNQDGLVYLDYSFIVNGQLYEFIADSTQPNVMDTDIANLLTQMVNSFKTTNQSTSTDGWQASTNLE